MKQIKRNIFGRWESDFKLIHSYLTKIAQRIRITNSFSSRSNVEYTVPQGLVLGPSQLTIKTPERRQRRRLGVFIVNFEHISHFF